MTNNKIVWYNTISSGSFDSKRAMITKYVSSNICHMYGVYQLQYNDPALMQWCHDWAHISGYHVFKSDFPSLFTDITEKHKPLLVMQL